MMHELMRESDRIKVTLVQIADCRRVSHLPYGGVDAAKRRHATRRRPTRAGILQHVQPTPQAVSAHRVPGPGQADPRGASRSWVYLLGAVRGHAVLPARARPFAPGNLRRLAE